MTRLTLVDTSVWVGFLKGVQSEETRVLDGLVESGTAAICGLVRCELLPMGRTAAERAEVESYFQAFRVLHDPPGLWDHVLELKKRCRAAGVTGIGVPDLVIASVAEHHNAAVLSADAHFRILAKVVPTMAAVDPRTGG